MLFAFYSSLERPLHMSMHGTARHTTGTGISKPPSRTYTVTYTRILKPHVSCSLIAYRVWEGGFTKCARECLSLRAHVL